MATETPTFEERSVLERLQDVLSRSVEIYGRLDTSAKVSFWIVAAIVTLAVAAPLVAPYGPAEPDYDASLAGPSVDHPLGTDLTGRDVLSRVLFGARISILVGVVAVAMAVAIGVPIGAVGGYIGGWVDEGLMRLMDIMMSFPSLVLALALVGALGPNLRNVILVIGIVYTPQYARLIRGSVLSVKEEEFVEAAENTGLGDTKILFKHVIPNAFTPVLVQGTFHVATAIIFEASLSFLGLGVQPPTATWGVMIADGRGYLPDQWWISTFPGIAIMITVMSFNLLGDGLRDELDPRSETEGGPGA
jgi:ABC-type dipeptide/oligopeptide/nickel transport system permease subunit